MVDIPMAHQDWMERRACGDGTGFVPELSGQGKWGRKEARSAAKVCLTCPVEIECGEMALKIGAHNYGVWSGETFTSDMVGNKKRLSRIKEKVEAARNAA